MRKGWKKMARTLLCWLLVAATMLTGPLQTFLAVSDQPFSPTDYLLDVQLFQSETMEECIRLCEDVGYIPTKYNLNDGAIEKVRLWFDEDAPCVMLGYKTTKDRSLAITDISMLQMSTGYQMNYQDMMSKWLSENQAVAEGLAVMSSQVMTNYDHQDSPAAQRAISLLNLLYVDDLYSYTDFLSGEAIDNEDSSYETLNRSRRQIKAGIDSAVSVVTGEIYDDPEGKTGLGDFILEGNGSVEFYSAVLSMSNMSVITTINNALCVGLADYNNAYDQETGEQYTSPWLERVSTGYIHDLVNEDLSQEEWKVLDAAYLDSSREVSVAVQTFATEYLNAVARSGSDPQLPETAVSLEEADLVSEDNTIGEDWLAVHTYRGLNEYRYDDRMGLGEWIVEMGKRTYSTEEDYRRLYPLVCQLNDAQIYAMRYCGMAAFVGSSVYDEEMEGPIDDRYEECVDRLRDLTGKEEDYRVCIWNSSDTTVLSGHVGITNDAIRNATAKSAFARTTKEAIEDVYFLATAATTILTSFVTIATFWFKGAASYYAWFIGEKAAETSAACAFFSGGAKFFTMLGYWFWVVEIVVLVIYFMWPVIAEALSRPSSNYQQIPTALIDAKRKESGIYYGQYSAVWEPYRHRVGDLNAYEGKGWNCLYVTRDKAVGSPIVADADGTIFLMQKNPSTPEGYEPMKAFGQANAADTNGLAYEVKQDGHNYLFFHTEDSLAGRVNQGTAAAESTSYISDIVVVTDETSLKAKAAIQEKEGGYYVLDYDLAKEVTDAQEGEYKVSYLGYSTTQNPELAVTDIRVMGASNGAAVKYGEVSYSCAGVLANGDAIYYTRDELAGTPVHAELKVVEVGAEAPEGWEPVVYFSGAPVYTFGRSDPLPGSMHNAMGKIAIYFEPEVKYTSGEVYVGGMYFYSGVQTDVGVRVASRVLSRQWGGFANVEGYSLDGKDSFSWDKAVNLAWTRPPGSNGYRAFSSSLLFAYRFTYNPYRAIRDVCLYESDSSNVMQLPGNLAKGCLRADGQETSASYVPCEAIQGEHFYVNNYYQSMLSPIGAFYHEVDGTHAYLGNDNYFQLGSKSNYRHIFSRVSAGDPVPYVTEYAPIRLRGLYVAGPMEGAEPLKASDVVLSQNAYPAANDNGCISVTMGAQEVFLDGQSAEGAVLHSVQAAGDPYQTEPRNLGLPDGYDPNEVKKALRDKETPAPSYGFAGQLYLYLRGTVRKPTYISSVYVGTYTPEMIMKQNPELEEIMLERYYNVMGYDMAQTGAMASATGEVLQTNLASKPGNAWYDMTEDGILDEAAGLTRGDDDFQKPRFSPASSYVAVSRTDDPSKAIRGLLLVRKSAVMKEDAAAAPDTITVSGGVQYYLARGSAEIAGPDGEYFLYYSYNSSSMPGSPLTELRIDSIPLIGGHATTLVAEAVGKDVKTYCEPNMTWFIHCACKDVGANYIRNLYVGVGNNMKEAMADLLNQGCCEGCIVDINQGAGSKVVLLGYKTFTVSPEKLAGRSKTAGTKSDPLTEAVRGVLVTVGEPSRASLVSDGVIYRLVSEKSLNAGTTGKEIYLYTAKDYYTVSYNTGKPASEVMVVPSMLSGFASPISKIGLAAGDRVPYNTTLDGQNAEDGDNTRLRWENLLSDKGARANLNYGVFATDESGKQLLDKRIYLFLHREDNSVRPGAEITGGFLTDTVTCGSLYQE